MSKLFALVSVGVTALSRSSLVVSRSVLLLFRSVPFLLLFGLFVCVRSFVFSLFSMRRSPESSIACFTASTCCCSWGNPADGQGLTPRERSWVHAVVVDAVVVDAVVVDAADAVVWVKKDRPTAPQQRDDDDVD